MSPSIRHSSGQAPGHPFYLEVNGDASSRPAPQGHEELAQPWVGAGDLKVGDKVRQADGTTGTVRIVKTEQKTQTMYNLDVATLDNFYVGEQGWLVHNQDPIPLALYRVVSDSEYEKLLQSGQFDTIFGSGYEEKQFWTTLEDAQEFANLQGSGKIVSGYTPNPNKVSLEWGMLSDLKGGKPYVLVREGSLSKVRPMFDLDALRRLTSCF